MESNQTNNSSDQQSHQSQPNPASTPSVQPASSDLPNNQMLMGVLAYLGILVIIPYMMAKHDAFVQFHVRQGIVLAGFWVLLWVIDMYLWRLFYFMPLTSLISLGLLVLSIIGIVYVLQKKETALPLVGGLAKHVTF